MKFSSFLNCFFLFRAAWWQVRRFAISSSIFFYYFKISHGRITYDLCWTWRLKCWCRWYEQYLYRLVVCQTFFGKIKLTVLFSWGRSPVNYLFPVIRSRHSNPHRRNEFSVIFFSAVFNRYYNYGKKYEKKQIMEKNKNTEKKQIMEKIK